MILVYIKRKGYFDKWDAALKNVISEIETNLTDELSLKKNFKFLTEYSII